MVDASDGGDPHQARTRAAGRVAGRLRDIESRLIGVSLAGGAPPLLARMRVLFFLFAVFNLVLAVPATFPRGFPATEFGLVSLVGLGTLWATTLRRGSFGIAARIIEPLLLFTVATNLVVVDAVLGVFYVGLYFGALYGSRSAALFRGVSYLAALAAAYGVAEGLDAVLHPSMFAHLWGALLSSLVMSLLADAVHRQAASEQVKDEFLAVISHELRTPLTSVLGYLYTLERHGDRLDEDQARHLLERARVNAERQKTLVDDLLDVSRILEGTTAPVPQEVRVAETVRAVTELHDLPCDAVAHAVPNDQLVRADPRHLEQILSNLLTNAMKYGAPPIEVTSVVDPDDGTITLRVRDQGPGVPAAFRPVLFDRFSQYSTGNQRSAKGVGLGLWIARELARANGGELRYEPQRDTGACFALVLPVPW